MVSGQLNECITELGLAPFRDELHELVRPCVDFTSRTATEPVAPFLSKTGGYPDLPEGMAWPTDESEVPLRFLGRLSARDAALAHPGIRCHLLFFAEWEYSRTGVVIPVSIDAEVTRTEPPPWHCGEERSEWPECTLTAVDSISLPNPGRAPEQGLYCSELLSHGGKPDAFWGKKAMRYPVTDLWHLTTVDQSGEDVIRFGGYPLFTQSHPLLEFHAVGAPTIRAGEWVPLMTFSHDEDLRRISYNAGFCGFMVEASWLENPVPRPVLFWEDHL